MREETGPKPPAGDIVLYQPREASGEIRVLLEGETVWLTQAMIAELYQTSIPNINIHLKKIYEEGELGEPATVKEYLIVRREGSRQVSRKVLHYSLDAILAVGYRVKSPVATRFRQWATARLREYLVKGFALNDERLKGADGVTDYFDELLARIREIRASEARVYQRIREIFALAVDYREGEQETQRFFASMQNKMHYAATGHTAAEIIRRRADSGQPNMGLTTWKGDRVIKRDVVTAKNYLDAREIDTLNRITVMFLDQAEFRAQRRRDIHKHDWQAFLDKFLRDTELPVLGDASSVSHEDALDWAHAQYDAFAERRRLEAERQAESRYVEDLRASAGALEQERKKKKKKKKKTPKKKPKSKEDGRKRGPGKGR
jgi:hypothetical protein